MIKLLVALLPNDKILLQISQEDKMLAHVELDAATAESVASQITTLCRRAEKTTEH